jgi:hypothetical protein
MNASHSRFKSAASQQNVQISLIFELLFFRWAM